MAYTAFDRLVRRYRFSAALPHIRPNARVCDLGCGLDAGFLRWARSRIRLGVGLDRRLRQGEPGTRVVAADITRDLPVHSNRFDHVLMLAVLEHLSDPRPTLRETFRILVPGGSLVMTWPNPAVDPIVHLLHRLGIVSDEMESDQHQRRIPRDELLTTLREIGFERFSHCTFEWGLNNLLVAHKPRHPTPAP